MTWADAIFGYLGLPLLLAVIGGIVTESYIAGAFMLSIWGIMYGYSFIKFSDNNKLK